MSLTIEDLEHAHTDGIERELKRVQAELVDVLRDEARSLVSMADRVEAGETRDCGGWGTTAERIHFLRGQWVSLRARAKEDAHHARRIAEARQEQAEAEDEQMVAASMGLPGETGGAR